MQGQAQSMAATGSTSVLKRKLAAAREADQGSGRSALRALRLSLARTAKELFDLSLAVIGGKQARCEHEGVEAYLADDRLLVLLDGANGQAGAVSLDAACVAALLQQQIMGRVSATEPVSRAFTGTDAALAEPLIEGLLSRAADLVDAPDDQRCLAGFRFGAWVEDARSLLLALEADRFRVFDLTIDIAEGAMQGAICLFLPDIPPDPAKGGQPRGPPGPRMEQAFGVMRAELTATICRLRIPLVDLAAMQPGDVLPLLRERLEETELVTINGHTIAAGRLGQINGLRALRLNETTIQTKQSSPHEQNRFATRVMPREPIGGDSLVVDGTVVSMEEGSSVTAGLPAVIDGAATATRTDEPEKDADNLLDRMTPQEAAAEISRLAGLDPETLDEPEILPVQSTAQALKPLRP